MPFDEKLRRFVAFTRADVTRMLERQQQRTAGNDGVRYNEDEGTVVYTRHGAPLWRTKAELIGTFSPELGLYRFAWAGRQGGGGSKSRVDVAMREASRYAISDLTADQLYVDSEEDAEIVSGVIAQLSRADGIMRTDDGPRSAFLALYEDNSTASAPVSTRSGVPDELRRSRFGHTPNEPIALTTSESVVARGFRPAAVGDARGARTTTTSAPPPGSAEASRRTAGSSRIPPPGALPTSTSRYAPAPASMSITSAPVQETPRPSMYGSAPVPTAPAPIGNPSNAAPAPPDERPASVAAAGVRDPSRDIFRPVAQIVLGALLNRFPHGFHQALVLVQVDVVEGRARFSIGVAASDEQHDLHAVETSRELLEAVAKMVGDDARDGNGRWRRLSARLTPTARGVSVDMETC